MSGLVPSTGGGESSWCSPPAPYYAPYYSSRPVSPLACATCGYKRPNFYCQTCVNLGHFFHSQYQQLGGGGGGGAQQPVRGGARRMALMESCSDKRLRLLSCKKIVSSCRDKIEAIEAVKACSAREAEVREKIKLTRSVVCMCHKILHLNSCL